VSPSMPATVRAQRMEYFAMLVDLSKTLNPSQRDAVEPAFASSRPTSSGWRASERRRKARQVRRRRAGVGLRRAHALHAARVRSRSRQRVGRNRVHARSQVFSLQSQVRRDVRLEARGADRAGRRDHLPVARELRGARADRGAGAVRRPPASSSNGSCAAGTGACFRAT
jgi:hypothetical protein